MHCDAAQQWAMNMQDGATSSFDSVIDLHDFICYWLLLIIGLVGVYSICLYIQPYNLVIYNNMSHSTVIEVIWTIVPALVLIAIAMPSFRALYLSDEVIAANLTIKCIAHQWYWSYQLDDTASQVLYDSYMLTSDSLSIGQLRLLDVDNSLVLPIGTIIRLLGTSTDVIHSFAMPSFGIKIDCMPGRLNQANILINRAGSYYGQCSELCGAYHSFMPIKIDAISAKQYIAWLKAQQ